MSDNQKQTVIEDGTIFDGNITSDCGVTVRGQIKGELQAPSLHVNDTGSVKGQVVVTDLQSEGELSGEIEAETVALSGKISDETVIRAKSLQVNLDKAEGGVQVTFGNCQLKVGEKFGASQKNNKKQNERQHHNNKKNEPEAVAVKDDFDKETQSIL